MFLLFFQKLSGHPIWTWSNVGQIIGSRVGHGVILIRDRFMIVGGPSSWTDKNEVCNLNNGKFNCIELASSLTKYAERPILFLVDAHYKNC